MAPLPSPRGSPQAIIHRPCNRAPSLLLASAAASLTTSVLCYLSRSFFFTAPRPASAFLDNTLPCGSHRLLARLLKSPPRPWRSSPGRTHFGGAPFSTTWPRPCPALRPSSRSEPDPALAAARLPIRRDRREVCPALIESPAMGLVPCYGPHLAVGWNRQRAPSTPGFTLLLMKAVRIVPAAGQPHLISKSIRARLLSRARSVRA